MEGSFSSGHNEGGAIKIIMSMLLRYINDEPEAEGKSLRGNELPIVHSSCLMTSVLSVHLHCFLKF